MEEDAAAFCLRRPRLPCANIYRAWRARPSGRTANRPEYPHQRHHRRDRGRGTDRDHGAGSFIWRHRRHRRGRQGKGTGRKSHLSRRFRAARWTGAVRFGTGRARTAHARARQPGSRGLAGQAQPSAARHLDAGPCLDRTPPPRHAGRMLRNPVTLEFGTRLSSSLRICHPRSAGRSVSPFLRTRQKRGGLDGPPD